MISIDFNLLAQDDQLSEIISSITEEFASESSDPEAGELLTGRLYELSEKPVNLNSADESELSRLFFLTDFQIKALAEYIHSSGRVYSIYEIAAIPGFDRELAGMLIPFITLKAGIEPENDTVRVKSILLSNFSTRFPVSDTSAPGPPWKLFSKVQPDLWKIFSRYYL